MIKKIVYLLLSLVLTIFVVGAIFVAGALSKNLTIYKYVTGTKYDTISEDKYNALLIKSYIKLVNTNTNHDVSEDFVCKYIIEYGDEEYFCYDGGDYALYRKSSVDDYADSKTKVVQFFDKDNNGFDKNTTVYKTVVIPSFLRKIINKI